MFRKKPQAEPYDEELVHDVAGRPVEGHAHTPAYLTAEESFAQLAANAAIISDQAVSKLNAEIPHLEASWNRADVRNHDTLRELTVLFPAHTLTAFLRDVAGQPDSPRRTAAVDRATEVAVSLGDRRLAQIDRHDRIDAVHVFFREERSGVSRHMEALVAQTLAVYLDALRD